MVMSTIFSPVNYLLFKLLFKLDSFSNMLSISSVGPKILLTQHLSANGDITNLSYGKN